MMNNLVSAIASTLYTLVLCVIIIGRQLTISFLSQYNIPLICCIPCIELAGSTGSKRIVPTQQRKYPVVSIFSLLSSQQ